MIVGSCSLQALEQKHFQADVAGFQCTLFGESGFKTWEIDGKKGNFEEKDSRIDLQGLRLKIFNGKEDALLLLTLESPEATVLTHEHKAWGNTYAFISTPQYTVLGQGWTWEKVSLDAYKAHLKADVRVVFKSKKWHSLS